MGKASAGEASGLEVETHKYVAVPVDAEVKEYESNEGAKEPILGALRTTLV